MSPTKLSALSALADLLPKDILLKPTLPKKDRWTPIAITIVYRETLCTSCGATHIDMNPNLLLTEENPLGARQSTSTGFPGDIELPVEFTTVTLSPIKFCIECLDTSDPSHINMAFAAQRNEANDLTAGAKIEKGILAKSNMFASKSQKPPPSTDQEEETNSEDILNQIDLENTL